MAREITIPGVRRPRAARPLFGQNESFLRRKPDIGAFRTSEKGSQREKPLVRVAKVFGADFAVPIDPNRPSEAAKPTEVHDTKVHTTNLNKDDEPTILVARDE